MRTRAQKWGNSLALRIPKPIADELNLEPNAEVELTVEAGALRMVPLPPPKRRETLEDLLLRVTDENRHDEVDSGPAVGREVW